MEISYRFIGNVQGVMFRQTFIRAALRDGLVAGASNRTDGLSVDVSLSGDEKQINKIIEFISAGNKLNSWDAKADSCEKLNVFIPVESHQVTTSNVDSFNWSSNVEMYL